MKIVGIICEYNPLHLGHQKQFKAIRKTFGEETAIVCLMSGNYVQRGAPAIVDKAVRAKAAVMSGADLVLELPVTYALSSAEGFAAGGVSILGNFCDYLCFGSETGAAEGLIGTAKALLSEEFTPALRAELEKGLSFPAARAAALEKMGLRGEILANPNDILAVEYCKAMLSQNRPMQPLPIRREGCYHAQMPDPENPSATAVRKMMADGGAWEAYVPQETADAFRGAVLHSISAGERAVLGKLRTMSDAEFESLPYGSEGLWRKLMHACRSFGTLEEILAATKSKRYTMTRLNRMVMCAFLGITKEMLEEKAPYCRILAFNNVGRSVLKQAKQTGWFVNAGEAVAHPYWELEKRCGDLYGLFAKDMPDAPGAEEQYRVYYHREQT